MSWMHVELRFDASQVPGWISKSLQKVMPEFASLRRLRSRPSKLSRYALLLLHLKVCTSPFATAIVHASDCPAHSSALLGLLSNARRSFRSALPQDPRLQTPSTLLFAKGLLHYLQDTEYQVSPSTPLLSTAIDENGWVCGKLLGYLAPCQVQFSASIYNSVRQAWHPFAWPQSASV